MNQRELEWLRRKAPLTKEDELVLRAIREEEQSFEEEMMIACGPGELREMEERELGDEFDSSEWHDEREEGD